MWKRAAIIGGLSAAWFLLCWVQWQETIAVVPNWSVPLEGRSVEFTGSASDVVVLKSVDENNRLRGPVELLHAAAGPRSRLALQTGDELLRTSRDSSLAVVRREGVIVIVDLKSNETISSLRTAAGSHAAWFVDHRRVVIVQRLMDLLGYDVATGKELWKRDGVQFGPTEQLAGGYEVAGDYEDATYLPVVTEFRESRRQWQFTRSVSAFTGMERGWILALLPLLSTLDSPCGRYVLVEGFSGEGTVHDAETGRVLWRTGAVLGGVTTPGLQFSDDGDELFAWTTTIGVAKRSKARWQSATGEVVQAPPKAVRTHGRLYQDWDKVHLSVGLTSPGKVEKWLEWLAAKLPPLSSRKTKKQIYAIMQAPERRNLGLISTSMDDIPDKYPTAWVSGNAQILVQTRKQLEYYSVPPRRDWGTLIKSGIIPPLFIVFAWAVIRQIKSQMRSIAADDSETEP